MMKKSGKKQFTSGITFVVIFIIWTWLIQKVDVKPVGQNGTDIGFATFNCWFHKLTGVHMGLYTITDWLGLVPVFVCIVFGGIGLRQLIQRKSLFRVDFDLIYLGIYYVIVIFGYLFFEIYPINYRPILIEGIMEASYPSSTTLLVLSVMPTLMLHKPHNRKQICKKGYLRLHDCVFCIYGDWKIGCRRALVYGYCGSFFLKYRIV